MPQYARQPKVLVIQDISLIGRCSSLTALPVLSCAGINVTLLPTALLSTHTGGFPSPFRRILTDDMQCILDKWSPLPVAFDAIYVGYLASEDQFAVVEQVLERFLEKDTQLYVDPVMGDHGRRYSGCTPGLTEGFLSLARRACVIFPNRTEANLLLGRAPEAGEDTPEYANALLDGLLALGAGSAVLTGVEEGESIGAAIKEGGQPARTLMHHRMQGSYPGTGDLYASCVIAGLLTGQTLAQACHVAGAFMEQSLKLAIQAGGEARFGVPFERVLPWLSQQFHVR
ncbi:MAG: PfkB family carbohydrate kinase [Christensenellales bacterium]